MYQPKAHHTPRRLHWTVLSSWTGCLSGALDGQIVFSDFDWVPEEVLLWWYEFGLCAVSNYIASGTTPGEQNGLCSVYRNVWRPLIYTFEEYVKSEVGYSSLGLSYAVCQGSISLQVT